MLLREQAWSLMEGGYTTSEVALIMDKKKRYIHSYLWHEKQHRGLEHYPFPFGKQTFQQIQIWNFALEGKDKRQITALLHVTLKQINHALYRERKKRCLASYLFTIKSEQTYNRRRASLGNIYHPEVNHRQLFKELAH